jgi:adenine-specific DNA-methyltransferase
MKYMGSKRLMLQNGLGQLLKAQAKNKKRIVDLFSGSASVSWFAAQNIALPVLSADLQWYSKWVARSVLCRRKRIDASDVLRRWIGSATESMAASEVCRSALELDRTRPNAGTWAAKARELCDNRRGTGPVWRAYGGYYFSPSQAATLDTLRRTIPSNSPARWVCQGALIVAASKCAAAPGHTAQPFATSRTAGMFLREAWLRDPLEYIRRSVDDIASRFAKRKGSARVGDALAVSRGLRPSDLVFVDPPYSGVHYSRFYHVLETIARGKCGAVTGTGRYPATRLRRKSEFSIKSTAHGAMRKLFESLSDHRCTVIVTFPLHECSNGLSGEMVLEMAQEYFVVKMRYVTTTFSTLGGNGLKRRARSPSAELMLLLAPR